MLTRQSMVIVGVAVTLNAVVALAVTKSSSGTAGTGTSAGPTPTQQQLAADQKALTDARSQLSKAQGDLSLVVGKLRTAFESSPDFVAAFEALKQAQAAYDAAKAKVLEVLKAGSAAYPAALKACDAAKTQQAQLKDDADASTQQRIDAAGAFMQADSTVTKLEAAAFDADQPTKDAKAAYDVAVAKVNDLRKQFEQSLTQNADYTTAKTAVDTDQKQVTDLEAKIVADAKADQAAQAAAAKAAADAAAAANKAGQTHTTPTQTPTPTPTLPRLPGGSGGGGGAHPL